MAKYPTTPKPVLPIDQVPVESSNATILIGEVAILPCRTRNLEEHTVRQISEQILVFAKFVFIKVLNLGLYFYFALSGFLDQRKRHLGTLRRTTHFQQ